MSRSLQERLAALQQSVTNRPSTAEPVPSAQPGTKMNEDRRTLEELGFTLVSAEQGTFWCREMRYDVLTLHGKHRFADAIHVTLDALAKVSKCKVPVINQMRFYDTETTGLGTGAGTIPFLHAVGQFEEDEFVVYQYFLGDYSGEQSLLISLVEKHFDHGVTVVSFNGKSFDWPMLRGRLAMYRMDAPDCPHVDLLYPSRRLWKHQLPRVTLSCVEEEVLGLHRVDDLPGKEAPSRYFAYVEGGDAAVIDPVLEHNATDVCSLVSLTALLSERLEHRHNVTHSDEWVALGRLYDEWREFDLADRCFRAAVEAPDVTWKARWLKSLHHKRRGQWPEACNVWEEMAKQYTWSLSPVVELAKYCEHRAKDLSEARAWTRIGLQRALNGARHRELASVPRTSNTTDMDVVVTSIRKRLARIERKLESRKDESM